MFLAPNFFGGPLPEFLKSIYKIQSDSDHVVKFQGDQSRELGEHVAKQKKTSGAEYKPVRNGGSGRPNNKYNSNARSLCGPGNEYFISVRQVSLPVDFRNFATY